MQESRQSHFMGLPAELRCHIYTFLPELVYKPVFPTPNWSPVGTCCWPVYRIPTSVLQISKAVHKEVGDTIVQTILQKLNDHHRPTIVLGPHFKNEPTFSQLSHLFWKVASGVLASNDTKFRETTPAQYVSHHLADWVVWRLSRGFNPVILLPEDSSGAGELVAGLEPILLPFVEQTLKRMSNNHVPEVNLRFLVRGDNFAGNRHSDHQLQRNLYVYSVMIERSDARYKDHHGGSDIFNTFVIPNYSVENFDRKTFTGQLLTNLRRKGLRFDVELPCLQDTHLFDETSFHDQPQENNNTS